MQNNSLEQKNEIYRFGYIVLVVYVILTAVFLHIPFFGDGVALVSHPANFMYDNHFSNLIIPGDYDTGHPPFIPLIFAGVWEVFGRNLFVSHLIMLAIIILLYNSYIKFCSRFLAPEHLFIPTILFLFFPVIIAQTVLMSADIFMALFFFWAINALYDKKRSVFIIACSLLLLGSLRGVLYVIVLLCISIILNKNYSFRSMIKIAASVFFAALPFIAWNIYHYSKTGWILTHAESPWIEQRQMVTATGFLQNTFVFIFRLTEAGFVPVWIIAIAGLFKQKQSTVQMLWKTALTIYLVSAVFFIPFRNPILIRYFLVPHMIILLLASCYIAKYAIPQIRIIIVSAICILFTASHFIVYPEKINKAIGYNWDVTLAFLPYCNHFREETYMAVQNETSVYMDKTFLVGAGFPVYKSFYDTELTDDMENDIYQQIKIVKLDTTDLGKYDFVIYSNLMNDIPLSVRDRLRANWTSIYDTEYHHLRFEVFKNPGPGGS